MSTYAIPYHSGRKHRRPWRLERPERWVGRTLSEDEAEDRLRATIADLVAHTEPDTEVHGALTRTLDNLNRLAERRER